MKTVLIISILSLFLIPLQAEDPLNAARNYLDENRVLKQTIVYPDSYKSLRAKIAASHDPETKFGPYIWGLASATTKVLTPEQSKELDAVINAKRENPVNWHDVRNIVRVQSLLAMWECAGATEPAEVAALDEEWNVWNEMRLAYMFEEFVVQERFQRAAWAILTLEQRQSLIDGEFDSLIKKNTGHGRAFSAPKQVLKAIGEPTDRAAFDKVTAEWEKKWETVAEQNEAAAKFNRQRELAMDQTDETFAVAAAKEAEKAFNAFTTAERNAIRDLVQAGYINGPERDQKIAKIQDGLRSKMLKSYREHGSELLRRMGEMK